MKKPGRSKKQRSKRRREEEFPPMLTDPPPVIRGVVEWVRLARLAPKPLPPRSPEPYRESYFAGLEDGMNGQPSEECLYYSDRAAAYALGHSVGSRCRPRQARIRIGAHA